MRPDGPFSKMVISRESPAYPTAPATSASGTVTDQERIFSGVYLKLFVGHRLKIRCGVRKFRGEALFLWWRRFGRCWKNIWQKSSCRRKARRCRACSLTASRTSVVHFFRRVCLQFFLVGAYISIMQLFDRSSLHRVVRSSVRDAMAWALSASIGQLGLHLLRNNPFEIILEAHIAYTVALPGQPDRYYRLNPVFADIQQRRPRYRLRRGRLTAAATAEVWGQEYVIRCTLLR